MKLFYEMKNKFTNLKSIFVKKLLLSYVYRLPYKAYYTCFQVLLSEIVVGFKGMANELDRH